MEKKKSVSRVTPIWPEVLGELSARQGAPDVGGYGSATAGASETGADRAFVGPWMRLVRVVEEDGHVLTLAVANTFVLGRVQKNLLAPLEAVLSEKFGFGLKIELRVDADLFRQSATDVGAVSGPSTSPLHAQDPAVDCQQPVARAAVAPTAAPRLPERVGDGVTSRDDHASRLFGLESFVCGRRQRMAYSAVQRVLEGPGCLFNPLVIHGTSGVGKTHLLRGIASELQSKHPGLRVRCLDGERFLSHFVFHVRSEGMAKFRQRYRDLDVLIVDDLQLLADKRKTQEEFLHTFDALVHAGAQIVVSCDRPPDRIAGFIDPLVSRLKSGLVVPLQVPDYDARLEILRRHDVVLGGNLGDEVLAYAADSVRGSVREILGALKLLTAHAAEDAGPRDRSWAMGVLRHLVDQSCRRLTPDAIVHRVAQYFRLSPETLLSTRRDRVTALARHVAIYLCREFTHASLSELRAVFQRDPSTLRSADGRVRDALAEGEGLAATVQEIVEGLVPPA